MTKENIYAIIKKTIYNKAEKTKGEMCIMKKATVTCENCGECFDITANDVNCNETNVGKPCPHCGIRTAVPFMVYLELGGSAPSVNER